VAKSACFRHFPSKILQKPCLPTPSDAGPERRDT
jgi:hypothetical protein